jgi:selenocysteine lyase/cysteine desulfurase
MAVVSDSLSIAAARRLFAPDTTYLNAATFGLPPEPAWDAMQAGLEDWRHGRVDPDRWDAPVAEARATFARLHGVDVEDVAVGPQVSPLVGIVAASLAPGARVLCAEEDFTSVLFPFLAQRGLQVELVPLDRIVEAIEARTDLVAVSAVQSADGRVGDLDGIVAAARHHGARTLIDSTQGSGWLPLDAGRFDYLVCGGYKWLLNPRGTAFLAVAREHRDDLIPQAANWFAGEDPWTSIYGPPLRLAQSARRFDISPAWACWVAAAPALALLERVGIDAIHAHDVGLANRFRAGLGMPEGDSAIVSVALPDGAAERLREAGVMFAGRAGKARFSFHLWVTEDDVDRAVGLI